MLDIFSRKVICWEVHATETGDLAKAFIENAVITNGGARPDYIHADNGTSMTSKPVSQG
jgi:putative transposase